MPELRTIAQKTTANMPFTGMPMFHTICAAVAGVINISDERKYLDASYFAKTIGPRNHKSKAIYTLGLSLSNELLDKLIDIGITTEKKLLKCTVRMLEKTGIFEADEISLIMTEIFILKNNALRKQDYQIINKL